MKIPGRFKSTIGDLYTAYTLGNVKARLKNWICIHTDKFSLNEAIGVPEGSPVQDISDAIEKAYKSYGDFRRFAFIMGFCKWRNKYPQGMAGQLYHGRIV